MIADTHDHHVGGAGDFDGLATRVVVGKTHCDVGADLVRDALQRGDPVRRQAAVPVEQDLVRARTDDGDRLEFGPVQRQEIPGIFQQHDGFLRHQPCDRLVFGRGPRLGFGTGADAGVGIAGGRIQQAEPEIDAQHAFDGLIKVRLGQEVAGERAGHAGMIIIQEMVDACLDAAAAASFVVAK